MKTIIFDFNRTLHDPDTDEAVPGACELVAELASLGHELHLVSRLEPGRATTLESFGIADAFMTTSFVPDKAEAISRIVSGAAGNAYVVGDYLHDEIRAGGRAGAKTIWLKRGRFSSLMPETEHDYPWRTANDMAGVRAALFQG